MPPRMSHQTEGPPAAGRGRRDLDLRCQGMSSTGCVSYRRRARSGPRAAHIHEAPPGVPGPVVVPLTPPTNRSSSGCVAVAPELVKEIMEAPADYYVNVHNAAFMPGAIRGQLST